MDESFSVTVTFASAKGLSGDYIGDEKKKFNIEPDESQLVTLYEKVRVFFFFFFFFFPSLFFLTSFFQKPKKQTTKNRFSKNPQSNN